MFQLVHNVKLMFGCQYVKCPAMQKLASMDAALLGLQCIDLNNQANMPLPSSFHAANHATSDK